jgi:zinc transport system ATP-binding protein
MPVSNPIVSCRDIWVSFGENTVLEAVSLDIFPKQIVSIVGPNGAGKTTLLYVLLGFITPTRGKLEILGGNPRSIRRLGRIGYLPQVREVDVNFPVTVYDVVAMGCYARKGLFEILNPSDKEHIKNALQKVDAFNLKDQFFGNLSGGQKQRVLIARALGMNPDILLLDEPSTGLDVVAQDSFYQLLSQLRDEGMTILMVSHDIGAVSSFVDRIACMNRRIHFHGKPRDSIPPETLEKVFGKHVQFLLHDKECETCGSNS